MPVEGAVQLTNEGSKVLGWHTEHAGMSVQPQWLAFAGLRSDPKKQALTAFSDIRDAISLLDASTLESLYDEEYLTTVPIKLQRKGATNELRHAILSGPRDVPELRAALYGDLTKGLTQRATLAINKLRSALQGCGETLLQDAGSLIIVNNRLQAHARASDFETTGLGDDRWFQRLHVAATLWDLREHQRDNRRVFAF